MKNNDVVLYDNKELQFSERMKTMPRSGIREILSAAQGKNIISFGGGIPSDSCVPLPTIQKAFDGVMTKYGAKAFCYGSSEGELTLREYIALNWLSFLGIQALPEEIMIVNGSQQALDLIGKVFLDHGSHVCVESPTYLAALQAFSAYGPQFTEVFMDEQGPLSYSCDAVLQARQCRFFYTVPSFQNPSGSCTTLQRRKELAYLLNKHNCMLVEDDPYSQLYYDEKPAGPLCNYGVEQSIFCGTFSKMVAPGFRLGWIWAKKDVMRHLITAKQAADLCTGTFQQLLLYETLMQLDVQVHLANNRYIYKKKRDTMDWCLHTHLGNYLTWKKPGGGMFFWAKFKDNETDVKTLLKSCIENGVAFADGKAFFASDVKEKYIRLNFTQASEEEMEKGVRVMAEQIGKR